MSDTTTKISCEWLDQQLDAARREGGGPGAILERWLDRVKSAWGDLDAQQRLVQQLPDSDPQKRAVMRVMLVFHRLGDFRYREQLRAMPRDQVESQQAQRRAEFKEMVWQRDFSHLDSGLHHFAALRGLSAAHAEGVAWELAHRFHEEVVRLHKSRLGAVQYGCDRKSHVGYAGGGTAEVLNGGVRVQKCFRPTPGAKHLVRIVFYRATSDIPGRAPYPIDLPVDFDPATVELPKPKDPPRTYEAAPGSGNLAAFLLPYLHRVGRNREAWLKETLGLIVARYCHAEGVRGVPGPDTPPAYGGSKIDRWCPKKRKWLITPGVSLAGIDLVERTLTVQVAKGNGRRYVEMPITRLVSDFPKTTPIGDGIVRIDDRSRRSVSYAAVGHHSDGEVDIARFDTLDRAREMFGLPALSDADLIGEDPWAGQLQESMAGPAKHPRRAASAPLPRPGSDFASATAVLSSGFFD